MSETPTRVYDTSSVTRTQPRKILEILLAANGNEVPLADIMSCAAQYNACIHHLRKVGYKIINRTETRNGIKHSWYRLETGAPVTDGPARTHGATENRANGPRTQSRTTLENAQTVASLPVGNAEQSALFPETETPRQKPAARAWRDPEMQGGRARG